MSLDHALLTGNRFIQFYNTDSCSAASLFSSGSLNTNTDITFGWLQWLADNSQNKNIKIFLGLPASTSAAHTQDYLNIAKATALITEYACDDTYSASFGGVMLWEATYSDENTDADLNGQSYAYNIKQIFSQLSCKQPPQTTTTSTTTTTTTVSNSLRPTPLSLVELQADLSTDYDDYLDHHHIHNYDRSCRSHDDLNLDHHYQRLCSRKHHFSFPGAYEHNNLQPPR